MADADQLSQGLPGQMAHGWLGLTSNSSSDRASRVMATSNAPNEEVPRKMQNKGRRGHGATPFAPNEEVLEKIRGHGAMQMGHFLSSKSQEREKREPSIFPELPSLLILTWHRGPVPLNLVFFLELPSLLILTWPHSVILEWNVILTDQQGSIGRDQLISLFGRHTQCLHGVPLRLWVDLEVGDDLEPPPSLNPLLADLQPGELERPRDGLRRLQELAAGSPYRGSADFISASQGLILSSLTTWCSFDAARLVPRS